MRAELGTRARLPARERGLGNEILSLQMKKLITYKSQYYLMKLGVRFFIFVC